MFPTPDISHLSPGDYECVYEPAEDSFLLIDAIETDKAFILAKNPTICLEIGSGSGIVLTFVSQLLKSENHLIAPIGVDINPKAVIVSQKTAALNGLQFMNFVNADLNQPFFGRFGLVDILIFNPPYVVTPDEEVASSGIEASWAGGLRGRRVTDRLLPKVAPCLSKPHGIFYIVLIEENDPQEIKSILEADGLIGQMVLKRKAGPEKLSVWRFTFKH